MSQGPPMCQWCRHLRRANASEKSPFTCDAYPDGIPDAILNGNVDHRLPYAGDRGILFEAREEPLPKDLFPPPVATATKAANAVLKERGD